MRAFGPLFCRAHPGTLFPLIPVNREEIEMVDYRALFLCVTTSIIGIQVGFVLSHVVEVKPTPASSNGQLEEMYRTRTAETLSH